MSKVESVSSGDLANKRHLIIDVGNTTAKVAVFEGTIQVATCRTSNTDLHGVVDWVKPFDCVRGIISTVVDLSEDTKRVIGTLPFGVLYLSGNTPLPIKTFYQKDRLGTDRVAAMVGVEDREALTLIVDLGTCITYDVLCRGEHLGGNIAPGVSMRLNAMHHYTSRLPLIAAEGDCPQIGLSTQEAMRAGVLRGICYEIVGYMEQPVKDRPIEHLVLTGGDAHYFEKEIRNRFAGAVKITCDDELIMKGLNRILLYNETY